MWDKFKSYMRGDADTVTYIQVGDLKYLLLVPFGGVTLFYAAFFGGMGFICSDSGERFFSRVLFDPCKWRK